MYLLSLSLTAQSERDPLTDIALHNCPTYEMQVVAEEELLKADSKGDNQEAELLILDEFAVLCRDLYAFYPMLIRYVDNNR